MSNMKILLVILPKVGETSDFSYFTDVHIYCVFYVYLNNKVLPHFIFALQFLIYILTNNQLRCQLHYTIIYTKLCKY